MSSSECTCSICPLNASYDTFGMPAPCILYYGCTVISFIETVLVCEYMNMCIPYTLFYCASSLLYITHDNAQDGLRRHNKGAAMNIDASQRYYYLFFDTVKDRGRLTVILVVLNDVCYNGVNGVARLCFIHTNCHMS